MPGHARHHRLTAEPAVGADFARDARHFGGERAQLVDHRVDGFLELQDFAAHVHGDLARQVAAGHGDRHFGDVAHLGGQVARHQVDALGQVLPHAADFRHLRLSAELAVGADLARDARDFGREHAQLLDHRVDDRRRAQELALRAAGPRRRGASVCSRLPWATAVTARVTSVVGRTRSSISVLNDICISPQAPLGPRKAHPLPRLAFAADDLADARQLLRHLLVGGDDVVEAVGDLAVEPRPVAGQANREIAVGHRLQRHQQGAAVDGGAVALGDFGGDRAAVTGSRAAGATFLHFSADWLHRIPICSHPSKSPQTDLTGPANR